MCFEQTDSININNKIRQAIPNVNCMGRERIFSCIVVKRMIEYIYLLPLVLDFG